MPDGVFVPREGGVRFEPLPPPMQAEVERLLRVVRHRVLRLLEKRGALPAQGPEDALQTYQAHCLQQRLRWTEVEPRLCSDGGEAERKERTPRLDSRRAAEKDVRPGCVGVLEVWRQA